MENSDLRKIYPFTPRPLNLKEFYEEKEDENWAKKMSRKLSWQDYTVVLAVIAGSLFIMISVISLKAQIDLRSRATENVVNLYLYPKQITLEPNQTVSVSPKMTLLNNKNVAKSILTVQYDPAIISLQKFHLPTNNPEAVSFQTTPIAKANFDGKIRILLATSSVDYPYRTVISYPELIFVKSKAGATVVKINSDESQVVFSDGSSPSIQVDSETSVN